MNSPTLFITGTGTDAGKTYVTSLLARGLIRLGYAPVALKPVESGYILRTSDAAALADAADHPLPPPAYTFKAPLSPHLAARMENRQIELRTLITWLDQHSTSPPASPPSGQQRRALGPVLVEGAGGLYSPLGPTLALSDLIASLAAPWLLVAQNRLGVLHDVLSCLRAATPELGAPVGVVLSERSPDDSTRSNPAELAQLSQLPVYDLKLGDANATALTQWLAPHWPTKP